MKILYITPTSIQEKSGGGIETAKIHFSIKNIAENNRELEYRIISPDDNIDYRADVVLRADSYKDYFARVFLHSNFLYLEWAEIREFILEFYPDIIILDNSRLGFLASAIKNIDESIYIIAHFHNIELDYVQNHFPLQKSVFAGLFRFIEKITVKRDEKLMVEHMDQAWFLTARDAERAGELYGEMDNYRILPVCVEDFEDNLKAANEYTLNLVFLGSLWYTSNVEAIKWFLERIWKKLINRYSDIQFIIGGSDPDQDFVSYIKSFNGVSVYPDFEDKADIIPRNSIFCSPIQEGTGMKVKVAEALAMGLRVIGSEESLVGYEEIYRDRDNDNIIIRVTEPEDYIEKINYFINHPREIAVREKAKLLFRKYYSLARTRKFIKRMVDS
ncbi:MAG: glycosyltransferase family 4 protein [Halanaerobiales bacterium]